MFVAVALLMLLPVSAAPAAAAPALAADGPQLTVKVATLNLRQGPGTTYPVVGKLTQGAQAAIIGRNAAGDWYQVRPTGGSTGWVTGAPALVQVTGDLTAVPIVSRYGPGGETGRQIGGHDRAPNRQRRADLRGERGWEQPPLSDHWHRPCPLTGWANGGLHALEQRRRRPRHGVDHRCRRQGRAADCG